MRAALGAVPAAIVILLCLAGCGGDTAGEHRTPSASATATPTVGTTFGPAEARDFATFNSANSKLVQSGVSPDDRDIVAALVGAGFAKSGMQITADTTTIGRKVDSIQVSVRSGRTCLIGQFAGSSYISTHSPVLSTGQCLLGKTRSIDW